MIMIRRKKKLKNRKVLGTTLIIVMIVLMGLSVAMIASVSFPRGQKEYSNNYYFVTRQVMWILLGIVTFYMTSKIKYTWYKKIKLPMYIIGLLLLVAVLIFGKEVNGAKRWLSIGINIQPSEFAKLIVIIYMASIMDFNKKKRTNSLRFLIRLLIPLLIYLTLIIFERSFSSTLQIAVIGLTMIFVSGINISYFFITVASFGMVATVSVVSTPYRMRRILGYLGSSQAVHQAQQSLIAIGSGKLIGKFYGNGLQKYFYLPEIHTDYIFSGYAEEMGFIGALILILLYAVLLAVILITLVQKKDYYAKYILTGILMMFSLQIIGNIAVVSNLIPATGIPLPLMSYGGSTMIVVTASLGIVYNIIKSLYIEEAEKLEKELEAEPEKEEAEEV